MLRGYDNFFNIVIDDVTVVEVSEGKRRRTEVESLLLNGFEIVFVRQG